MKLRTAGASMEPEYLWGENGNHHMAWICFRGREEHMTSLIATVSSKFSIGNKKQITLSNLKQTDRFGTGLAKHSSSLSLLDYPLWHLCIFINQEESGSNKHNGCALPKQGEHLLLGETPICIPANQPEVVCKSQHTWRLVPDKMVNDPQILTVQDLMSPNCH